MRTVTDYLRLFLSLLPIGKAWSRDEDSVLSEFFRGQSDEFVRVEGRAEALLVERDTRYTSELISDHEIDLGIPDECSALANTLQERRNVAHAKLIASGRQDKQYYIDLAASMGYTVTITEFYPGSFHWQMNMVFGPGGEWIYFRSGASESGDPLIYVPGYELLNCIMQRYKPAHTTLELVLIGAPFTGEFSSAFDAMPSTSNPYLEGCFDRGFGNGYDILRGGTFERTAFSDGFSRPV